MTQWLNDHAKAIVGFLGAVIFTYLRLAPDGITANDLIEILAAGLTGGGLVWAIPNSMAWTSKQATKVTPGGVTVTTSGFTPGPINTTSSGQVVIDEGKHASAEGV